MCRGSYGGWIQRWFQGGGDHSAFPFQNEGFLGTRKIYIFYDSPLPINVAGVQFFLFHTFLSYLPLPELAVLSLFLSLLLLSPFSLRAITIHTQARPSLPRGSFPELSRTNWCDSSVIRWPYFKHCIYCLAQNKCFIE